jgi:adenine-specific DNA-methyltransferase
MRKPKSPPGVKPVEALTHPSDTRKNIPTAEFQSIAQRMEEVDPVAPVHYQRATPLPQGETRQRNPDLDPQILWRGVRIRLTEAQRTQLQETGEIELGEAQLVWRGKDAQDWSDLVVNPPPIYIQEKIHPKAIIDGLRKEARAGCGGKRYARSVRRFQRAGRSGGAAGILSARPALVEPHDFGRQFAGHGEPGRA